MGKWLVAACLRGCYRKKKARKKVGQFLQTWQPRRSQRFILAREWKGGGEQRIQYRITLGIDRSLGYNWVCGRLNSFEVVNDRRLGVGNLSRRGDISWNRPPLDWKRPTTPKSKKAQKLPRAAERTAWKATTGPYDGLSRAWVVNGHRRFPVRGRLLKVIFLVLIVFEEDMHQRTKAALVWSTN